MAGGDGKLKIVMRAISELIHPKYNPRQISESDFNQLKISLQKFEAVEPAVINQAPGRENIIVGGNQRIRAAQALGWTQYPCYEICLSEKEERELNVRLNLNTGEFDMDTLANNFDMDDLLEWGWHDNDLQSVGGTKKKEKLCPNCGEPI